MRGVRWGACLVLLWPVCCSFGTDWKLDQMVTRDGADLAIYQPQPVPSKFLNPIVPEFETEFQARARKIIAAQGQLKVAAGNTYFENEKRTYGYLMAQVLSGREAAIKDLQLEDAQAKEWHRETEGIDLFACFTLKHQVRKYFYFGDMLEPAYRERMQRAAKSWTSVDPLRRHHYAFKQPGGGWGPDQKDSWVDVRTTENLYLMRVTSIYLFAEAAGNQEVAAKYKRELLRYAATMYRIGMGEWDSENYHGHSIGPLCNLYDFARDEEVRLAAKACLDWVFATGAVKYYRGGFCGPTKRDYNHAQPFGGSAANMLWLHFGDCPIANEHWESDEVHLITSAYRPPPAVIHLARKNFERPVELFASKPSYSATTGGQMNSSPQYLETMYLGETFLMGSLSSGTSQDGDDVNGFKILWNSKARGATALQGVPGPDAEYPGSPQYQQGKVAGPNRVAQDRNLAIWLVKSGAAPWRWVVPSEAKVSEVGGVTFLEADHTWVALRPMNTSPIKRDEDATRKIAEGEKPKFPGHFVLAAEGKGGDFCGVAIEVGEAKTHGSFAEFRKGALGANVDESELQTGIARYKSADGKWLGIHWNDSPSELGVWRNGERHDWKEHAGYLYHAGSGDELRAPIDSRWGRGELYVEAGKTAFSTRVSPEGKVSFTNGDSGQVRTWLAK